ncbi:MAG: hypothetical protein JRH06_00610 [Deltaproteobacteria bacterium]|nr:hypothetical protein [Deltaproteobacteria bacterium]
MAGEGEGKAKAVDGHDAEKGGSWQSATIIASKSIRKSLNERKKPRKSWSGGKGRKITPRMILGRKTIPIDRQDALMLKKQGP